MARLTPSYQYSRSPPTSAPAAGVGGDDDDDEADVGHPVCSSPRLRARAAALDSPGNLVVAPDAAGEDEAADEEAVDDQILRGDFLFLMAVAARGSLTQPAVFVFRRPMTATSAAPTGTVACPYAMACGYASSSRTSLPHTSLVSSFNGLPPKRKPSTPSPTGLRRSLSSASKSTASSSSSSSPRLSSSSRSRDATADAAAAAAVSRSQQAAHSDLPPLDWNTFFQLRKTRRRIQLAFSVFGGLAGGTAGGLFLGSGVAEPVLGQIPLDPFLTLGLMTFGFAALGWLAGPSLGNVVFYALKRQYKAQMTLKETQFFARIKKNRVDPSASSAGNPVPDFYGEKISSVAGYRQWLKDQRAFNKKRTTFV
ncbi:presequence translocase-associated motor subunit [Niveomyces insectorum RCEF 264]|uniref:Presequence translocated-associated motor subunit PAM17 n=1 Tax=Niveomyces insectorum RCEF 264 TaxID=1081102 RepID=A0A167M5A5_9HYPO|nr:presequence translocase-associated motor subunit [Niveomyces insectorum RCEF 264]